MLLRDRDEGVYNLTDSASKFFYGWWIVIAGAITMALSSGLFFTGFGFFFEPIRQTFGWSRTMLSGAYAVSRIQSAGMGPLIGYLIQKYGPRKIMTTSFIFFGLGFIFLSQTNSVLTFYIFFLILSNGADPPGSDLRCLDWVLEE